MNTRTFGRTNLHVTPVGFGGAEIGFIDLERDAVTRLLRSLLDEGLNLIDTAAMYRTSEELIGEAVGDRRDDYVLVSKCGTEVPDIDAKAWTPELITQSVDRSLRSLKTDHLDVMLLHSCELDVLKQGDALDALIRAREAGKVRHVGYSGDNEAVAYAASLPDIAVIQTSINICDQVNIEGVLPTARDSAVGVMAKRPIANAAWKAAGEQPSEMYEKYASTYANRFRHMGLTLEDLGIEGDPAKVWPDLALRFTLSQPGVTVAIIGTTNIDHVRSNIASANRGELSEAQLRAIRDAFTRAAAADAEPWTGQT